MADAAVEFLLENIKQLLIYNASLITDVKGDVESLYSELGSLKAFLKDSSEKRSEYEVVKQLVREIQNVAYEVEDVIDTFVIQAAVQKARRGIKKYFHYLDYPKTLRDVGVQIQGIRVKVKGIYDNKMYGIETLQAGDSNRGNSDKRDPVVEEENVVGFDAVAATFVDRLVAEQEELEVLSVIGMGGLGKTTLAKKIFTDPNIEMEFYTRAWVYVSETYNRKDVFLRILSSVSTQPTDESMYRMSEDMLADELRKQLKNVKYLVVLDDVWTIEAWDHLKIAFPNSKNKSRVILTTRHRFVAAHANRDFVHHLDFLTADQSWELLGKKVFRRRGCPQELETVGKRIAKDCDGLPLAIVVIAGLLMKTDSKYWWDKVAISVKSFIAKDRCNDVLAMSYNHLPYHLKACFLYFGIFPEDFEIPVWKLIRLWIAEGLVQQVKNRDAEDVAEENLEELVERNLVLVSKRSTNGRIKTCRIHDMLREMCLKEAEEENFFKEIKGSADSMSSLSLSPASNNQRRLCIHSNVIDYISSKPSGPRVRSLMCFAVEEMELPMEHISFISDAFKLIRVLEIRAISFPRFPSEIIQLIHLRYIAFSAEFKLLPASISKLWNTQTLIIETTSRTLDIHADIWSLNNLRHLYLYTSGTTNLPGPSSKTSKISSKDTQLVRDIQTISTISPESCTTNVLARTPKLKKLGVRGKLLTLVEEKGGSSLFDNLAKLDRLETLKLLNDTFPSSPVDCKLRGLPHEYKFPPNLRKLTLSNTYLNWEHMSVLAKLPSLEVLKLKEHAFTGYLWEARGDFRILKVLQLWRIDFLRWNALANHFPRLESLVLKHCQSLEAIPEDFANIPSLKLIDLYFPSSTSAASARLIHKERQEKQQEQQLQQQQRSFAKTGFKLIIFPQNQ